MVEEAANDYAKIFRKIDPEREINPICANIEDMLARLDEFETLLTNVKAETTGIMESHVSSIIDLSNNFNLLKERIDHLETFVDIVDRNVDKMEQVVDIAKEELHVTDYSLKGLILKPLLAKARSGQENFVAQSNLKDGEFQRIPIFKTSDYFGNTEVPTSDPSPPDDVTL